MSQEKSANPDDCFKIYLLEGRKKTLVAHDSLFELRKKEIKLRKGVEVIKVVGEG